MLTTQRRERLVTGLLMSGVKALEPCGQPALIPCVWTFGELATFNPHIHFLVADVAFLTSGMFQAPRKAAYV